MNYFYTAPLLVFLGLLPCLAWLFYYLKKDCHPEPKSLIAKTMFVGILVAPLAVGAELLFGEAFDRLLPGIVIMNTVWFYLWGAFVEEWVKYLAVRFAVINKPDFDEPIDAMIYMISASMGFAAIENILYLFNAFSQGGTEAVIRLWLLRFAGAILLHAVSSALLGYFLGLSWFYANHSKKILALGFVLASFAHFSFNVSILATDSDSTGFLISSAGLLALIILISFLFNKLKKRMTENPSRIINTSMEAS